MEPYTYPVTFMAAQDELMAYPSRSSDSRIKPSALNFIASYRDRRGEWNAMQYLYFFSQVMSRNFTRYSGSYR